MEQKENAERLLGIIFSGLGISFLAAGIFIGNLKRVCFSWSSVSSEPPFLIPGALFLIRYFQNAHSRRQIIASGRTVMAEITEILSDTSLIINGENPWYFNCVFIDPQTGAHHVFRSANLTGSPSFRLQGTLLKVYVDLKHPDVYYVDTASVLH